MTARSDSASTRALLLILAPALLGACSKKTTLPDLSLQDTRPLDARQGSNDELGRSDLRFSDDSHRDYAAIASPATEWAISAGGEKSDYLYAIWSDAKGSVYLAGAFQETTCFGSTTLHSNGDLDVFVAKLAADGTFVWATSAGGPATDIARAVAVDKDGAVYITGRFGGDATFGPASIHAPGGTGAYVAKLDSNGVFTWATAIDAHNGVGDGIGVFQNGGLYITGDYGSYLKVGTMHIIAEGERSVFAAGLDVDGNWNWLTSSGGTGYVEAMRAACDNQDGFCVAGYYLGAATFGTRSLSSQGDKDIFVAKVSQAGTFLWATSGGGPGQDNVAGVGADATHCYVAGYFEGPAVFGSQTLTPFGHTAVVARADVNGFDLAVAPQGKATGVGVTPGGSGQMYFVGQFQVAVSVGNLNVVGAGLTDVFVASLNSNGAGNWLVSAGGSGVTAPLPVTWRSVGGLVVGGDFYSNPVFGPYSLKSHGNADVFAWSLREQ